MWHAVYRQDNADLFSVGTILADPLSTTFTTREYADRPDQGPIWWPLLTGFLPVGETPSTSVISTGL